VHPHTNALHGLYKSVQPLGRVSEIQCIKEMHCVITLAFAYRFLAQPHWISACLMMIHGPKFEAMQQLSIGLCNVWDAHICSVIPMTTTAVPCCYNWFRILKLVALTLPVGAQDMRNSQVASSRTSVL